MLTQPTPARLYIFGIIGIGGALCATAIANLPPQHLGLVTALIAAALLAASSRVALDAGPLATWVSHGVTLVSLLLVGPQPAVLVACASGVADREPASLGSWPRWLFGPARAAVTLAAAGWVYDLLGGGASSLLLLTHPEPFVLATTVFFLGSTVFPAAASALVAGHGVLEVWRRDHLWTAPGYFVGGGAAALAAIVAEGPGLSLAPLAAAPPLYLIYRSHQAYVRRIDRERDRVRQVSDMHLATIEALARAIDAKDQTPHGHLRRMQRYAAGLAAEAGATGPEVEGIVTAALLHDIGKLVVPAHILAKPGPLSRDEFWKVHAHTTVGAAILEEVPFPYPVAPIVRGHHERWDGRGYPDGLAGEAIPLGARILAVVDHYEALTSERPYHTPVSREVALGLLQQEAGHALDPALVTHFVRCLPTMEFSLSRDDAATPRRAQAPQGSPALATTPSAPFPAGSADAFHDIAMAHRELVALYDIARSIGTSLGISDTMELICSKLSTLVPFSASALFLYDEAGDTLECTYASGVDADLLKRVRVASGEGITGWVARTRRTLVNASPQVDLEATGLDGAATRLRSALICPLLLGDRLIGAFSIYHEQQSFYSDDDRRLLNRIAEQTAAVVDNSMLFERIQAASFTDSLTGLPNARFLHMHLANELARAERLSSNLTIMLVDLDHFKEINDTHGHHAGDRALCEVASRLQRAIRPYDICVRYAGDEFVVVLSGCTEEEAEDKRLEIQRAVEASRFEAEAGIASALSVSIGKAVFPIDGRSHDSLLARADRRMYRDKARRKARPGGGAQPGPPKATPSTPECSSETELTRATRGLVAVARASPGVPVGLRSESR